MILPLNEMTSAPAVVANAESTRAPASHAHAVRRADEELAEHERISAVVSTASSNAIRLGVGAWREADRTLRTVTGTVARATPRGAGVTCLAQARGECQGASATTRGGKDVAERRAVRSGDQRLDRLT